MSRTAKAGFPQAILRRTSANHQDIQPGCGGTVELDPGLKFPGPRSKNRAETALVCSADVSVSARSLGGGLASPRSGAGQSADRHPVGSSSKTLRNSEIERSRTSSLTNVSGQAAFIKSSLETTSPACSARETRTCMTFGSPRLDSPAEETLFSRGWASQPPTLKSPFTGVQSDPILLLPPAELLCRCSSADAPAPDLGLRGVRRDRRPAVVQIGIRRTCADSRVMKPMAHTWSVNG